MSSILENVKIDWTEFRVVHRYDKHCVFFDTKNITKDIISAEKYLSWAKAGLENDDIDEESRVNIISHVKRAIDCKCEEILKKFGYKEEINEKNYPKLKEYFKGESAPIINFISKLMDLNIIIIDEVRKLRNITEHDYLIPDIEDVKRAVSVAELFIIAIDSKVRDVSYYIEIESRKYEGNQIRIHLVKGNFESSPVIYVNSNKIGCNEKEYFKLLNILITGSYKKLPELFKCNSPLKYINYKEYIEDEFIFFEED